MNKRLWFLIAGTIVLAGCGNSLGVCETPGISHGENRGRDQAGYVECTNQEPTDRATPPAPQVNP